MKNITDTIASKFLGRRVDGSIFYNPALLVAIPRIENRSQYNIDENELPFTGFDVWHAYEFSCLTENGLPVTRVLKMRYPCDSKFIVESKALKLYLNSFNMSRYGASIKDALALTSRLITNDLSKKLETTVDVCFLDENTLKASTFDDYSNIYDLVNVKKLEIDTFKEALELLESEDTIDVKEYKIHFDSLRSNCRVTHQPDFGDVFIYYKSKKYIKEESLIKYLCSFRSEYHFHEECCEMIFKRLYDLLDKDDELMVTALYTRRGGIDICPARWTTNLSHNDIADLIDVNKFARKSIKQ